MPKRLHRALVRGANKKHLKGSRRRAYIYGGMYNVMHRKRR